MPTNVIDWL